MDQLTPVSPTQQKFFELRQPLVQPLVGIPQDSLLAAPAVTPTVGLLAPVADSPITTVTGPDVGIGVPTAQPPVPTAQPEGTTPVLGLPYNLPGEDSRKAQDAVQINPVGTNLVELVVRQAYTIDVARYPAVRFGGAPHAVLKLCLVVTTEIYAEIEFIATGEGLRGEISTDQAKQLFATGALTIFTGSLMAMSLLYKDDREQKILITEPCENGQQLVDNIHAYAGHYEGELATAASDNQSNRMFRRFVSVLLKEGTAVREWMTNFPTSLV